MEPTRLALKTLSEICHWPLVGPWAAAIIPRVMLEETDNAHGDVSSPEDGGELGQQGLGPGHSDCLLSTPHSVSYTLRRRVTRGTAWHLPAKEGCRVTHVLPGRGCLNVNHAGVPWDTQNGQALCQEGRSQGRSWVHSG